MSETPQKPAVTHDTGDVQFNTDIDMDAELEDIKRQVDSLQEDLQLKQLQDSAARDEGTRKTAAVASAATSAAPKGNSSVFVNGLDARTTEDDLRVFFAACGAVVRLTILQDRSTGRPKGSAYVEFENPEQAQAAIMKDGQSLHGRPLKVAMKRDNVPAFQRGGRGGARGGRGAAAVNPQIAAMATMMATMMASGSSNFSPYAGGGGGRGGGRGRGRGRGRDSY